MEVVVNRQDARYESLLRGHNLRFPENTAVAPGRIVFCSTPEDAKHALQDAVHNGVRPTIRSGGHCYENFTADNPGGTLIDLSLMNAVGRDEKTQEYVVFAGAVLGDAYQALYKQFGVTMPAGSCYSVGAGGHISGGGYGLLSRLHGLSSDWLSSIDILTVDANGHVMERRIDKNHDPGLFRVCRGAGGAGFGLITAFRFRQLPAAPREVMLVGMHFPWKDMTEKQFTNLLMSYGDYWMTRGRDPDTWGLFALLEVGPRRPGSFLNLFAQFCQPDGAINNLAVLNEFLNRFLPFHPVVAPSPWLPPAPAGQPYNSERRTWLDTALMDHGRNGARAKYKSAYMRDNFVPAEAQAMYRFYTGDSLAASSSVISIDSYGGAINRPELLATTAIAQRKSVMKLQWQCYWTNPNEDDEHLRQLDHFFTDVYTGPHVDSRHQGTPWGPTYEGCYMNYPDIDMLRYPFWPQLYYGSDELYGFLQKIKRAYDPNNIFHHAMSIRA